MRGVRTEEEAVDGRDNESKLGWETEVVCLQKLC